MVICNVNIQYAMLLHYVGVYVCVYGGGGGYVCVYVYGGMGLYRYEAYLCFTDLSILCILRIAVLILAILFQ